MTDRFIMNPSKKYMTLAVAVTILLISAERLSTTGTFDLTNQKDQNRIAGARFNTIILNPPIQEKSNFDNGTIGTFGPSTLPNYNENSLTMAMINHNICNGGKS